MTSLLVFDVLLLLCFFLRGSGEQIPERVEPDHLLLREPRGRLHLRLLHRLQGRGHQREWPWCDTGWFLLSWPGFGLSRNRIAEETDRAIPLVPLVPPLSPQARHGVVECVYESAPQMADHKQTAEFSVPDVAGN